MRKDEDERIGWERMRMRKEDENGWGGEKKMRMDEVEKRRWE